MKVNENRLKIRGLQLTDPLLADCLRPFRIHVPLRNAASMCVYRRNWYTKAVIQITTKRDAERYIESVLE